MGRATGVIGGQSTLGHSSYSPFAKREAEAEPLILGNLGAGYSGLGFGHAGIDARTSAGLAQNFYPGAARVIAAPAIAAPAIATTGVIGGYSTLGYSTYGKREAEAEPYLGYAGLGYAGLGYGYGKSAPCVNAANFPVPCRGFY